MAIKRLKILICDDIVMNRFLLKQLIKTLGHESAEVENGKLAVEAVDKDPFDLVLMDVEMPVMNGIDATALIKNKYGDKLKVVALTAHDPKVFQEDYVGSKFDSIMTKPFSVEKLHELITVMFNNA
jgi:CheY-like chemotaxis protein